MRLADLDPKWISEHVFTFLCPHCKKAILSCKNAAMGIREQRELVEGLGMSLREITPTNPDTVWTFSSKEFDTLSVTPSIDASKSGCWHGFITNGQIVGGV